MRNYFFFNLNICKTLTSNTHVKVSFACFRGILTRKITSFSAIEMVTGVHPVMTFDTRLRTQTQDVPQKTFFKRFKQKILLRRFRQNRREKKCTNQKHSQTQNTHSVGKKTTMAQILKCDYLLGCDAVLDLNRTR